MTYTSTYTTTDILRDLLIGQSTADSIALRLKLKPESLLPHLTHLLGNDLITTFPLEISGKPALTIYRITQKGKLSIP